MDSRTMTGAPAPTASPALAVIWNTTPVMWAFTSSGIERSLLDHLRVDPAGTEGFTRHDAPMKLVLRLDALDDSRVEGPCQPGDGFIASASRRHQLRQQRIVVYRNLHPFGDPALHADTRTRRH